MKPEKKARQRIDQLLIETGWDIQDYERFNLGVTLEVAIREFHLESGHADYLLFVDGEAVGVVEAKVEGTTLSGVTDQSGKYAVSLPEYVPRKWNPPPFVYESTGVETFFRNLRDPAPALGWYLPSTSRKHFMNGHRSKTLSEPDLRRCRHW